MIEGSIEKNSSKKYWLVLLSAILIAIGVAGITYLTLMRTQDIADTSKKPTPTPIQSEVKQLEEDEKAISSELSDIEKEVNDINADEASLDDVPEL